MDSDEVINQSPPYVDIDLYGSDQPLLRAVAANGGEQEAAALSAFGRRWGTAEMFDLARQANENPPRLRIFDPKGARLDQVEFHPAYHRFMTESIAAGLHVLFPLRIACEPRLSVAGVARSRGPSLRAAADGEAFEQFAIQPHIELLRPAHAFEVVLILALQPHLNEILAAYRKVVANRDPTPGAEWEVLALTIVL